MSEETKTVDLYNPHDGLTGRDGGPYLDQVERKNAEDRRAEVEDREPDYDNAPATAGTPLVTGGQLLNMANPASTPSQYNSEAQVNAVKAIADADDAPVSSVGSIEVPVDNAVDEPNPADPTVTSEDKKDEKKPGPPVSAKK